MSDDHVDLNVFIVSQCEAAYRWVEGATNGLTEEQLYFQPTPDTNSIAWLIWHLSRWRDRVSAIVAGEPQVWVSDGWDQRFDIDSERTGLGDTPEQVAAFRVSREVLLGYAEAAHRVIVERVSRLTPQQFEEPVEYIAGETRPAWRALGSVVGDSAQHVGQINYLRGMITGYGWR